MRKKFATLFLILPAICFAAFDKSTVHDFRQSLVFKSIQTKDNVKLSYTKMIHPQERAAILIVQGVNESCSKWSETINEFYQSGFTVYCYDHRGQGRSTHLGSQFDVVHVDNFEHYVDDLDNFVETQIKPAKHNKLFVLAHSMGGAIATRYLQVYEYRSPFSAMLLSAPMHEIGVWSVPEALLRFTANSLKFLGLKNGVPFANAFDTNADVDKLFNELQMTHDKNRFRSTYGNLLSLKKNATTRPSVGWALESFKATEIIRRNAHKVKTPILLYQAGKDILINANGQNEVCKKAQNCTLKRFENAYHEIFNEVDDIRSPAMSAAKSFFEKFIKKKRTVRRKSKQ